MILFVVDTLRPDRLTPYGCDRDTSPNVDRFAREGVLFEQALSQASFTMASMGTLMTSTYPFQHGASRHPSILGEENHTLAEAFRAAGYATAAFVCNPLLGAGSGFSQGFDTYRCLEEAKGGNAEGIVDLGIRWMKEQGDRPFFLWLHCLDPHFPYLPRYGFMRVSPAEREGQAEYTELLRRKRSGRLGTDEIFFRCPLSPAGLAAARKAYDSEIAFTDRNFGRLLEALKRSGIADRTVVVFTSDHGENLGEKGFYFCHGFTVYDIAIRVPLLFRLPGGKRGGTRIREPVRLLDLMPTLLSLTGVPAPGGLRGRDLSPLLLGRRPGDPAAAPPAYSESEPMYLDGGKRRYPHRKRIHLPGEEGKWRSVHTDRWHLVLVPKEGKPEVELYEPDADPGEERNLAAERPEVTAELERLLEAWMHDPSRRPPRSTPELDAEWARRLRNIGYIK